MPDSRPPAPRPAAPSSGPVLPVAYAGFTLVGWTGLFVPTLLRVLQAEFDRSDAEFGVLYLVTALTFAAGALGSGLVADRGGRRGILPAGALVLGVGMLVEAAAPTWPAFLVGAALAGLGCGAVDAVLSSVVMDLSAAGGGGLNRLHLFYSVGALSAPIVVGSLVGAGAHWRLLAAATGVVGLALAAPLVRAGAVPPRARAPLAPAGEQGTAARPAVSRGQVRLALAALGAAIACYVAAEAGVSSWLVGFLHDEPMTVASLALGGFWGGLAAGRLMASRFADRFEPIRLTTTCAVIAAAAVLAAVALGAGSARMVLFMLAGLAFGPVYPMIMSLGGSLAPHRAAAVAGVITAAGVAGAVSYPPLMGVIGEVAGLGAAMAGAAVLAIGAAGAVAVAGRVARRGSLPGARSAAAVAIDG